MGENDLQPITLNIIIINDVTESNNIMIKFTLLKQ